MLHAARIFRVDYLEYYLVALSVTMHYTMVAKYMEFV